ncbi:MAG: hypothetical protein HYY24_07745 [Verrucomicrobia bacterium]|nr:hypothetical protein [Verrucomicrobiota bacterium]
MRQPDEVRQSEIVASCFIAYKRFDFYWVRPGISAPNPPGLECFAVVADKQKKIVKTFYPCRKPKSGKKLWP